MCRTTGSACAYVAHPLDEEGSSVVRSLQPVDSLEVCIECVGTLPNHGMVVMLKVGATVRLEDVHFITLLHSRRLRRSSSRASKVLATLTVMREMISSGRLSQAPLAAILFAGSMVLHCGKVEGKVMQVWMNCDLLPR
jgi:hypothetical protein